MLAFIMSLRAHISYMLAVLKYPTCFRVWYLVCLIYVTFEKLNSKNYFIEEFGFHLEVYLEPT